MRSTRPLARASWLPAAVCALAGLAVFQFFGNATRGYIHTRSLLWWWGSQWFDPAADSQQGLLILAIAGWLLWRNLRENSHCQLPRADCQDRNSAIGPWKPAMAMLGGLALHLLGYAVQQTRLSILGVLLFAWGVLALAGGRRWGRAAAFPLTFLVFAIPLSVLDTLGFALRMGVVDAVWHAARAVGFDLVRNGTQLFSPHGGYQYDVAAACSGVRSLMALAALSLLLGYLNFRRWWARSLLLVLCVPFTYLGNVVRIFAVIFAAEWLGQAAGTVVHEGFGFLVFLVVLGLQLAVVGGLKRWIPATHAGRPAAPDSTPASGPGEPPVASVRRRKSTVVLAVAAAALVVGFAAHRIDALPAGRKTGVRLAPDGRNPVSLPTFLGTEWIGRPVAVSALERAILPPDTGYSRKLYVSVRDRAHQVLVSIVLSGRDRSSIHRPEICLVGQGWTIRDRYDYAFKYPGVKVGTFPATVLHVQHEAVLPDGKRVMVPSVVAYWFMTHDRVVATNWERMFWGAVDRLHHLRSPRWAYVLLQTDVGDGDPAALARMQAVLDRVLPDIQEPPPR